MPAGTRSSSSSRTRSRPSPGCVSVSMAEIGLLTGNDSSSTDARRGLRGEGRREHEPQLQRGRARLLPDPGHPPGARAATSRRPTSRARRRSPSSTRSSRSTSSASRDPIGRRFGLGRRRRRTITIVGLVRDGKASQLREKPRRMVYLPYTQETDVGQHDLLRAHRGRARRLWGRGCARSWPRWTRTCPSPT